MGGGGGNCCCAVGCTNSTRNTRSVSYHRFPGEASLREQWLRAVRRDQWSPTSATRLCSAHFDTDCFEASSLLKLEFGLVHGNRKLKPGAVPTLFKHKEPQRPPIERGAFAKRRRAELVDEALSGAAAPGPSAEDVPDRSMDDVCEDWTEDPSAFKAVDVGCQANVLHGTSRKSQTTFKGRSRGVKKKIIAVARTKQHGVLLLWLKTIIRHIYWCARTSNGDGQLVLAKWTSLMRHIINIHEHPNPLHPVCAHGSTPERTETFNKLKAILMAPHLLRDIPFLSPKEQTSGLESYHAVLIHFAPKATKFRYEGMLARTYVAALHFNHNADRKVLLDENGKPRFRQKWSKGEKQWTLVAVKEKVTYDYVRKLVDSVLECVTRWPSYAVAERATYRQSHDTLSSRCGAKPQMEDAIARHRSRFSAGSV
ncbi:hypothetical protein ISCGN_018182 [Ixodes scapularis]